MVFAFKAMRDRVQNDIWLSTDFFAEVVTYRPASGQDRTVTVHIDGGRNMETEEDVIDNERETIRVLISRVEDDTNERGYVKQPSVGDQILRSRANDPTQEPYVFIGELDDQRPGKWRLVFERFRSISQGIAR